jgi:hypothetical protein
MVLALAVAQNGRFLSVVRQHNQLWHLTTENCYARLSEAHGVNGDAINARRSHLWWASTGSAIESRFESMTGDLCILITGHNLGFVHSARATCPNGQTHWLAARERCKSELVASDVTEMLSVLCLTDTSKFCYF